jgi:hypothetical protein
VSDHFLSPDEIWIRRCLKKIWHECKVSDKNITKVTQM